jgi:hypothetical protein
VKNSILHELAHVLVGKGHGHDEIWFRKALDLGCKPQAKIKLKKNIKNKQFNF